MGQSQKLHSLTPEALRCFPFTMFEKATPLLTAGDQMQLNTMTIGWGGVGTLWSRPVCTVYVRPQRYTYEFMERQDTFTVSVFDEQWGAAMKLCGARSGRSVDKVKACGFTPAFAGCGAPYFEEAGLVLVCRKLYADDLRPEKFLDPSIDGAIYPQKDYHRMYIGEVLEILKK